MARARAAADVGSLVTARTSYSAEATGSFKKVLATEPPWLPVLPSTTKIFFADMFDFERYFEKKDMGWSKLWVIMGEVTTLDVWLEFE